MGTTPNYGWTYPDPGSSVELWTHFETLADAIDTSLGDLQDDLDAMAPVQYDSSDNNASALATTGTPQVGTTTCGGTFVAPPSGKVMVTFNGVFQAGSGTGQLYMGPQVREGSSGLTGTVVFNPSTDPGAKVGTSGTAVIAGGCSRLVTGLTPGATYHVAANFWNVSGSGPLTINYFSRSVAVYPQH